MTDWLVSVKHSRIHYLGSILVSSFVGITSRICASYLNRTRVHNLEQFHELVMRRPEGKPLITVCNHDSCCDDPCVFGAMLPIREFTKPMSNSFRNTLAAKEVCFSKPIHSLFFRLGQVMPVVRGDGVYQPVMNESINLLNEGKWVHLFPEGKLNDKKETIRLKWGVGRLIADAEQTPIVLPFYHFGMDDILPNKTPYRMQINKKATIVIGKPIYFDEMVIELKEQKKTATEIRKHITDHIQVEFYKLKEIGQKLHDKHINGST